MNPNHLTPNVRAVVSEAIAKLRELKKQENSNFQKTGRAFETDKELVDFFTPFYEKIKDDVDNDFNAFGELCLLEDTHGFLSGYIGGGELKTGEETVIEIK